MPCNRNSPSTSPSNSQRHADKLKVFGSAGVDGNWKGLSIFLHPWKLSGWWPGVQQRNRPRCSDGNICTRGAGKCLCCNPDTHTCWPHSHRPQSRASVWAFYQMAVTWQPTVWGSTLLPWDVKSQCPMQIPAWPVIGGTRGHIVEWTTKCMFSPGRPLCRNSSGTGWHRQFQEPHPELISP